MSETDILEIDFEHHLNRNKTHIKHNAGFANIDFLKTNVDKHFIVKYITIKLLCEFYNYPSFLLNVLLASVRVIKAIISRGIMFTITSLIPIPFNIIPRDRTIKNLTGFK